MLTCVSFDYNDTKNRVKTPATSHFPDEELFVIIERETKMDFNAIYLKLLTDMELLDDDGFESDVAGHLCDNDNDNDTAAVAVDSTTGKECDVWPVKTRSGIDDDVTGVSNANVILSIGNDSTKKDDEKAENVEVLECTDPQVQETWAWKVGSCFFFATVSERKYNPRSACYQTFYSFETIFFFHGIRRRKIVVWYVVAMTMVHRKARARRKIIRRSDLPGF